MGPIIIGVGGAYSGVGKTTVICEILRSFQDWGAIKYTKTSLFSSVTDDIGVLSQEGKDTKRFLDAGAGKVVWVQSPYSGLTESLSMATGMLSHTEGILIEGNSAIEAVRPDIIIFISGSSPEKWKTSACGISEKADIVIYDREPSQKTLTTRQFHIRQKKEYIQVLRELVKSVRA